MFVEVIQFHLPNGRQTIETAEVPDHLAVQYSQLLLNGCRLTAEVLSTGAISLCIENPEFGDYDHVIVKNGPTVQAALAAMIGRYTEQEYGKWLDTV